MISSYEEWEALIDGMPDSYYKDRLAQEISAGNEDLLHEMNNVLTWRH